jgi:hypothetical protein
MKKATPLISVDAIEPCLPFWTEALGFELDATVPHDGTIAKAVNSAYLAYLRRTEPHK